MSTLKQTKNHPLSDYYGPLLSQHVRTILESGLLLDEDYEVLLKASNFKIFPAKATKLPLGLIASTLTTLGSVFIAKRYDLFLVVLPVSAVTFGLLCLEINSMAKRRRHQDIPNYIVQRLIKVQKLNAAIIRYTKLRTELSSKKEKEILLYSENYNDFMKLFVEKYCKYFNNFLQELQFFANLTSELENDFDELKAIDIKSILTCDDSSVTGHLNVTLKVQDIYIFLSSKFLNYLGLTFCKNLSDINAPEMEFLLNKKLPGINNMLEELFGKVQNEFNNLRYSSRKKVEIDTKNKRSLTRHVSGKLQQTLIGAVNNLSIIMEKSQTVLHKVESTESENDVKKLECALSDLRDHAFATYESLNVLCKLYGILSDAKTSQDEVKAAKTTVKNSSINENVKTINHDDLIDPLEESYELFIPKNDTSSTIVDQESYVDQSGTYLNLMLKELRQSLQQHERFRAARNKRGIKDEDEECSGRKDQKEKEKTTPKFDLRALNIQDVVEKADLEPIIPPVPPPRPSKMPPPPPLPPPSFNLSNLEVDELNGNKRSLFENIRTLSSQLQGGEDVFGNSDCLSDSD